MTTSENLKISVTYFRLVTVSIHFVLVMCLVRTISPTRAKCRIILNMAVSQLQAEVGIHRKIECVYPTKVISQRKLLCPIYQGKTYAMAIGSHFQFAGRLRPSCGQAGHSTAKEPCLVAATPAGSCPRPARFSILICRHHRITIINSLYRFCIFALAK